MIIKQTGCEKMGGRSGLPIRSTLAALAGVCVLSSAALAGQGSDWPDVTPATNTTIRLAGETVMRLREAGGFTAEERAGIIRERLVRIQENVTPGNVMVRVLPGPQDQWASIYVNNNLLVTVTESLAQANNSRPSALAELYADRFRRLLPQVVPVQRDPQTGIPIANGR